MAPRVVVVGSANMDLVATAPVLPGPGQTVLGRDFSTLPGGKGANQAIAVARAGGTSTLIAAIGSDAFGVTLQSRLAAARVDTAQLRVVYGVSGVALVLVDDSGQNAIVVAPGANSWLTGLTDEDVAAVSAADVLLCQLEVPVEAVAQAATTAQANGTRVVLNATPARHVPDTLLAATDLLVVNRAEARTVADDPSGVRHPVTRPDGDRPDGEPAELDVLLELVPRAVVTMSAAGCWYGTRDGIRLHVPAPVVDTVDRTAVGDAFCGALAVAWGEGRELPDALRWASAAGASCARRLGASVAVPQRSEIDELYTATYLS